MSGAKISTRCASLRLHSTLRNSLRPGKVDWIIIASNFHACRQFEVKWRFSRQIWLSRQIWPTTPAEKPKRSQQAEDMTEFGF